jgi:predicted house-cleaning NTP pyrophosphatase (Maf/HAM1 superfamily)
MKLILASASPRRAEILRDAAIPFEVHAVLFDETRLPNELRGGEVMMHLPENVRQEHQRGKRASDPQPLIAEMLLVTDCHAWNPAEPDRKRQFVLSKVNFARAGA